MKSNLPFLKQHTRMRPASRILVKTEAIRRPARRSRPRRIVREHASGSRIPQQTHAGEIVARERAKAEKQAKFDAKIKAKKQSDTAPAAPNPKKEKERKAKEAEKENLAEYVEETPKGQKKG